MRAKDIMRCEPMWSCSSSSTIWQASQLMAEHDIGSLPVLDDQGCLEGIITDRDITVRVVSQNRSFETPIREIMSRPAHCIHPQADVREVESLMEQYRIRRLPVVDEEWKLLGIISLADLAHKYHGLLKEHRLAEVLETVSSSS